MIAFSLLLSALGEIISSNRNRYIEGDCPIIFLSHGDSFAGRVTWGKSPFDGGRTILCVVRKEKAEESFVVARNWTRQIWRLEKARSLIVGRPTILPQYISSNPLCVEKIGPAAKWAEGDIKGG